MLIFKRIQFVEREPASSVPAFRFVRARRLLCGGWVCSGGLFCECAVVRCAALVSCVCGGRCAAGCFASVRWLGCVTDCFASVWRQVRGGLFCAKAVLGVGCALGCFERVSCGGWVCGACFARVR